MARWRTHAHKDTGGMEYNTSDGKRTTCKRCWGLLFRATPTDMGNKESKGSTWIKPSACKSCGEIGHTSKECHDEWPHGVARHQTKGCFTSQISCFLCEATNHIPAKCQLYPIVEQVRQQVQERMHHTLKETLATRDSKKEQIGRASCRERV